MTIEGTSGPSFVRIYTSQRFEWSNVLRDLIRGRVYGWPTNSFQGMGDFYYTSHASAMTVSAFYSGALSIVPDVAGAVLDGGAQWHAGTGVPSFSAPNGSWFLRTDAPGADQGVYFRRSGAWQALTGG